MLIYVYLFVNRPLGIPVYDNIHMIICIGLMTCNGVISVRIALLAAKAEIVFDGEDINEDEIIGMNRCISSICRCRRMCMYIQTNIHIYVYVYLYIYTNVYIHICIYIYTYM
jgi:hypothetical protein